MFRRVHCRFLVLMAIAVSVTVSARPYVSGAAGLDFGGSSGEQAWVSGGRLMLDRQVGVSAAVAIGYEWACKWRTEFEVSHHSYRLDESQRETWADGSWVTVPTSGYMETRRFLGLMGNIGGYLPRLWKTRPYALAGVGAVQVSEAWYLGPQWVRHNDMWKFAYQGIFGVEVPVRGKVRLGLQYRLFHVWSNSYSHSGEVVVRWTL